MSEFICLDIETTGLDKKNDHIIEIAAVKFSPKKENLAEFQSFIFYPDPIPEIVEHLTGINQAMLAKAPRIEEVKNQLMEFCGDLPIVGHNINFDLGFLHKFDIPIPGTPIDTIHLSQTFLESQSYSLETLSRKFNTKHQPSHRALDDVLANIELFQTLLKQVQNLNPTQSQLWLEIIGKSQSDYHQILREFIPKTSKTKIELFSNHKAKIQAEFHQTSNIISTTSKTEIQKLIPKSNNMEIFVLSKLHLDKLSNQKKLAAYNSLISSHKFLNYLQNSKLFNFAESNLLLKIATKISRDNPLHSPELNLFKEDYNYIIHFLDNQYHFPEQDTPYLTDHFTFFKLLQNQELPFFNKIHFEESPFLEETFIRSQEVHIHLNQSDQGQEIPEISFAFAHFSKFAQELQRQLDYPKTTIILNALDTSSSEFINFIHTLKKHSPNPHIVNACQKLKHQSSKYLTWINLDDNQEASLHFVEKNIHTKIQEQLKQSPSRELILYSNSKNDSKFKFTILSELPEPNDEYHFQKLSQTLLEELQNIQKQGLIIAPSKNQITELHKELANPLDKKGISVLSQYVSGSKGKILDNLSNHEGPNVLICTHHFLLRNHPELQNLEKAFLTKIPMGLPFHPYYNWLKHETDNDFFNLTLPYTSSIIYQICQNLQSQNPELNELFCCDTRFDTTKWTQEILKKLPENIIVN